MTKEENIATLNEHLKHWKRLLSEKICDQDEGEKTIDALQNAIKALEQEPCEDCISREDAKNLFWDGTEGYDCRGFTRMEIGEMLDDLPPVTPQQKMGRCKNCKWWKDSDGLYRRGGHAESQCPINRREVFEGNGYCYMFEPKMQEVE